MLYGLIGIVFTGFWAFCMVDILLTSKGTARALPKLAWLAIVILFPILGGVLWLVLGRPRRDGEPVAAGLPRQAARPRVLGPEDAPDFEARIQRGLRRQAEDGDDGHRP